MKYYTLKKILEKNARYNVIFGERSNGKTYAVLEYAFKKYIESGERSQLAIIRRWDEDFVGANGAKTCYNSLMCNANGKNRIYEISNGKYIGVEYYSGRYYLQEENENGKIIRTDNIIAFAFSLTGSEHYKQGSFPNIQTILFDEFLTRDRYLIDEFMLFQNIISTIKRNRADVIIFMCGNTVNKYNPYFAEMGLAHAKNMKIDTIDVYTYGESALTIAVEYTLSVTKSKESDSYFAFDNPKLKMITGGEWELAIYPHCPCKYLPCNIAYTYFIIFNDEILQCEVIATETLIFTYIHRKTTELKSPDVDLIYSTEYDPRPNYRRKITRPTNDIEKRLLWFYNTDKVFYQDNDVGELVRNYLAWCKMDKIV